MRIAYDCQIFSIQKFGGISRYYTSISQKLANLGAKPKIFAGLHKNYLLDELPREMVEGRYVNSKAIPLSMRTKRFNQIFTSFPIKRFKPDIIHETYYSRNSIHSSCCPRVVTVYDMIHELFPSDFSRRDRTSDQKLASVHRADLVIAISHSTKADLVRLFDVPAEKIRVVHLGVDTNAFNDDYSPEPLDYRPYILFVGERGGYKNFNLILEAFASNHSLAKELDIIAFGGSAFSEDESRLIGSFTSRSRQVRHIVGDDQVLANLYRNATVFVYPSLYEGFGLPILEAMSANCPVLCSNTSSLPEVAGDAAEYFDPHNVESLLKALNKVVFSEGKISELTRKGQVNLEKFSWDSCAKKTYEIYSELRR